MDIYDSNAAFMSDTMRHTATIPGIDEIREPQKKRDIESPETNVPALKQRVQPDGSGVSSETPATGAQESAHQRADVGAAPGADAGAQGVSLPISAADLAALQARVDDSRLYNTVESCVLCPKTFGVEGIDEHYTNVHGNLRNLLSIEVFPDLFRSYPLSAPKPEDKIDLEYAKLCSQVRNISRSVRECFFRVAGLKFKWNNGSMTRQQLTTPPPSQSSSSDSEGGSSDRDTTNTTGTPKQ